MYKNSEKNHYFSAQAKRVFSERVDSISAMSIDEPRFDSVSSVTNQRLRIVLLIGVMVIIFSLIILAIFMGFMNHKL